MNDPDDYYDDAQARRLMFTVRWRGPWERLLGLACGLRPDNTLRWELQGDEPWWTVKGWLNAMAIMADARDRAWRQRHERRGTTPSRYWRRNK